MRIISGEFKGRRLKMGSDKIRPSAERVRMAIFNILPRNFSGLMILDLYAGSGALGIEALSRGAAFGVFVDQSHEAIRIVKANLETVGALGRARLMNKKVSASLKLLAAEGRRFDVIFLDPPYQSREADKTLRLLAELDILGPEAEVVVEHTAEMELAPAYGVLSRVDERRYGDTMVSFYQREEEVL